MSSSANYLSSPVKGTFAPTKQFAVKICMYWHHVAGYVVSGVVKIYYFGTK
jgi:hypothetical protein